LGSPLSGDKKPFPVVQGNFRKNEPQFSYDGKWLAYATDESGTFQVYVMSFPAGDQKIQVSTDGGGQPRWRKDGKELYYRALDGRVMALDIKTEGKLESGVPHMLFQSRMRNPTAFDPSRHMSSVSPDGQRFLLRTGPRFNTGSRSSVPLAPPIHTPTGQAGGAPGMDRRGGFLNDISNGLTVIQHWTAGAGKEEK
jgi:hypothetical protein